MNRKDYYNLMGIYLDAVFFPLLREQDFRQEGHRLEFADPADPATPLQLKGVVFNEMKGAMADPSSLLGRRLNRALFPTTCYGHNSGGEPRRDPDLTWEAAARLPRRLLPPGQQLVLHLRRPAAGRPSAADRRAGPAPFRATARSPAPSPRKCASPRRRDEATFPLSAQDEPAGRSMVQLAWLTCPIEDTFERAALGDPGRAAARRPGRPALPGAARQPPRPEPDARHRLPRRLPRHGVRRRPAGDRTGAGRGDRAAGPGDAGAGGRRRASRRSGSKRPCTSTSLPAARSAATSIPTG